MSTKARCICCHSRIEYHAYYGAAACRFFDWKVGERIGPLCPSCYRMLFREQIVEVTISARKLAFAECPTCGREMSEKGCAKLANGDKRKTRTKKAAA